MYKRNVTTKHLSTSFDEQTGRYSFPYLMTGYSLTETAMIDLERWMTEQIELAERHSKLLREYPEMAAIVKTKGSFRPSVTDWYDQLPASIKNQVQVTDLNKESKEEKLTDRQIRAIISDVNRFMPDFGTSVDGEGNVITVVTENGTRYWSADPGMKDSITNYFRRAISDDPTKQPTVKGWWNSMNLNPFARAAYHREKFREPIEMDLSINPENYRYR